MICVSKERVLQQKNEMRAHTWEFRTYICVKAALVGIDGLFFGSLVWAYLARNATVSYDYLQ